MKNILVTGISGYIGGKVACALAAENGVGNIVGIDVKEPETIGNTVFYRRDIREPIDGILQRHDIDTIVHLAFILPPMHDVRFMEDININGTRNVLDATIRNRVKHLLYTSSSTAYGFHPDNQVPLVEESPLRGNEDFTYSRTKRKIEEMIKEKEKELRTIKLTVLRPCFVVGPGFTNPLSEYLRRCIVPLPTKTLGLQYVHEDDLLDIIMIMLRRGIPGVFNVGGDGIVPFDEMVKKLGGVLLPIPAILLYALNNIAWNLHLSFLTKFPSPALGMARYPWDVSSERLKKATGFSYRYTSREAFHEFAVHVKTKK